MHPGRQNDGGSRRGTTELFHEDSGAPRDSGAPKKISRAAAFKTDFLLRR